MLRKTNNKLTLEEKRLVIDIWDRYKSMRKISIQKMTQIVSNKLQRQVNRSTVARVMQLRAEILCIPIGTKGCFVKSKVEYKFWNELIAEIKKLPGYTRITGKLVKSLAIKLRNQPKYQIPALQKHKFGINWWARFRDQNGWSNEIFGQCFKVYQLHHLLQNPEFSAKDVSKPTNDVETHEALDDEMDDQIEILEVVPEDQPSDTNKDHEIVNSVTVGLVHFFSYNHNQ